MNTSDNRITRIEAKLESTDEWRVRMDRNMEKMAEALDRLTRIEMHNNAQAEAMAKLQHEFTEFKKSMDDRLTAIEREMPSVKQARDGSFHIVKVIAAIVLSAAISSVSTQMLQRPAPAATHATPHAASE